MPGSKPGERRGGRKKGTPNKRTVLAASVKAELEARGVSPVAVLADAIAGKVKSDLRVKAAHILLPYLYAQKHTELRLAGVDGGPVETTGQMRIELVYVDPEESGGGNDPDLPPEAA